MNTILNYVPGDEKENKAPLENHNSNSQQEVGISLPRTERPEGPFEHSAETSGQTKAEEAEQTKAEQE